MRLLRERKLKEKRKKEKEDVKHAITISPKSARTRIMATSTKGCMESYDPATEYWNAYTERFDQYVLANDVKDTKKIVAWDLLGAC